MWLARGLPRAWGEGVRTLVVVNEPIVGSRRCTGGGLLPGRGGELGSSAAEFVEGFLAGGFGGPGVVEVGEPPNLGWDIKEAAAAATRPGPL
jgi:hypothetical protein